MTTKDQIDGMTPLSKIAFLEMQRAHAMCMLGGNNREWSILLREMQHVLAIALVTSARGDNDKIGKALELILNTLPELAADLSKSAAQYGAFPPMPGDKK